VTIRAHKTAVLDRLKADPFLASITFEGIVTGGPSHYVSVFVNSGFREAERLTGPQATSTFTFTIHSVGSTPDQAQLVAEHVFAQLLDYTPTVTGRRARRIRHAVSQPVQEDRDVTPWIYYCVDQFDLTSEPA
jgi:hypothetical protein